MPGVCAAMAEPVPDFDSVLQDTVSRVQQLFSEEQERLRKAFSEEQARVREAVAQYAAQLSQAWAEVKKQRALLEKQQDRHGLEVIAWNDERRAFEQERAKHSAAMAAAKAAQDLASEAQLLTLPGSVPDDLMRRAASVPAQQGSRRPSFSSATPPVVHVASSSVTSDVVSLNLGGECVMDVRRATLCQFE